MKTRFPNRVTVCLPADVSDALERVADAEMITVSDAMRRILGGYLVYIGAMKPPQQRRPMNGHANESEIRTR
jgi:hypothetical protein